MEHWSRLLSDASPSVRPDVPGSGAAGGVGFAGPAIGAELANGPAIFLNLVGAGQAIAAADLVVTGEGRLDEQTLMGKAPAAIADWSRRRDVPCVAVVGSRADNVTDSDLAAHGFVATYELVKQSRRRGLERRCVSSGAP